MTPQCCSVRFCVLHKAPPFTGSHTLLLFESSVVKTHEVVITASRLFPRVSSTNVTSHHTHPVQCERLKLDGGGLTAAAVVLVELSFLFVLLPTEHVYAGLLRLFPV